MFSMRFSLFSLLITLVIYFSLISQSIAQSSKSGNSEADKTTTVEFFTEIAGDLYIDGNFIKAVSENDKFVIEEVNDGCRTIEVRGMENWKQMVEIGESAKKSVNFYAKKALDGSYQKDIKNCESEQEQVFVVVEKHPELIGGMDALYKNLKYPDIARKAGIEGRVFVQFVVDSNGNTRDFKVIRGIGGGCDEAAIAAIQKCKFKPGMQRGVPVNVQYQLPVRFKLE